MLVLLGLLLIIRRSIEIFSCFDIGSIRIMARIKKEKVSAIFLIY